MSSSPCLHYDCSNRNSFGYCRTTVCINELYRREETESTSNKTQAVVLKPITNADRIRAMTDEELAEWFVEVAGWLPMYEGKAHPILKWLKQEADDEQP